MEARDAAGDLGVEIVRIEQLYPFPSRAAAQAAEGDAQARGPGLGAGRAEEQRRLALRRGRCSSNASPRPGFEGMRPQYAGRDAGASPATGLAKRHAAEQAALIAAALGHSSRAERPRKRRSGIKDTHGHRRQSPRARANRSPKARSAQWLKKPGEAVAADEPIASLETDKVSVEVPSPVAGVLSEQLVKEGDTVAVGAVIARIDEKATRRGAPRRPRRPRPRRRPIRPARAKLRRCAATTTRAGRRGRAPTTTTSRPCRRRCAARCSNIMSIRRKIQGTGKDGRLTKDDVHRRRRSAEGRVPRRRPGPGAAGESAGARSAALRPPGPRPAPGERQRRARQDVAAAPDHRHAPQGSAEHRRDADDVQRRRHDAR